MSANAIPGGGSGAPTTVFVSYARDAKNRAQAVIDLLQSAGFSVWWDGLIEGGEGFLQMIDAA